MIVADNGATKSEWYIADGKETHHFLLPGYNPATGTEKAKTDFLHEVSQSIKTHFKKGTLFFYSAGVSRLSPKIKMRALLTELFPNMDIFLETDLTGAARAIFGDQKGITAILGTGANAGYYDGHNIVHQPESLGFFLGDEGSGAYLGKQLLKAFLENSLPDDIANHLTISLKSFSDDWSQQLLKQPTACDYGRLASEMLAFRDHPYVIEMVTNAFNEFFRHIVSRVQHPGQSRIGFNGKVAFTFKDILTEVTKVHGFLPYKIISSPAKNLYYWHQQHSFLC